MLHPCGGGGRAKHGHDRQPRVGATRVHLVLHGDVALRRGEPMSLPRN